MPEAEIKVDTFEAWARAKLGVDFDENGRATAVRRGRKLTKLSHAALVNAARRGVAVGQRMTEAAFEAEIAAVRAVPIEI